jgi:hypothetical protein
MKKALHAALIKICTSVADPASHSWADGVVRKMLPRGPSFIGPNKWKSEGDKPVYVVSGRRV